MRRFGAIYAKFLTSSIQRDLEFKANFFANVAQNILWISFFVFLLRVVFTNTSSVAGWTEGSAYVLAATVFFTYSFCIMVFSVNLMEIPEKVRKGTLDFDLLKPVDSQFLVSIRKFHFDEFGTVLGGLIILIVGLNMLDVVPTFANTLMYIVMCICAVLLFYSLQFALMTLGIWLVRVDNLWALGEMIYYVARFPVDIFRSPFRLILTYYIPIAFIATEPTRMLLGQSSWAAPLWAIGWTAAALLVSRAFWRFASRHYTSASG